MFRSISRIIKWTGGYKRRLYLGVFFSFFISFATAGPTMVTAWALGQVIESWWAQLPLPEGVVLKAAAGIVFFILLRFLLSYWKAVFQESIGSEMAARQRLRLGDVLKRVSLGYFAENRIGDILAGLTTELSALELQSMKMVDAVLNGYVQLLAVVLCLAFFSPAAVLPAVLGTLLSALALAGIRRRSSETAPLSHRAVEDMSGAAIEYIRGLAIVKSFGQEGASSARFRNACRELKDINIRIEKGFVPYNCLHLLALKLASVGLVFICAWQTYSGTMGLSTFLMFILFSFIIFGNVENINDAAHVLAIVDAAMDKLEHLEQADFIDEDGSDIVPASCEIQFNHVSFRYDNREVLHDISLIIPPHTTTAIVGPSGSGKSTLCNLIVRFFDVNEGAVTVGGIDIRKFTCDSLLKNISMVFQNVYLFRDTIRNNIQFGNPEAGAEAVITAAKAARCHEFIMALPAGYDTMVGEGGASLSGGEKQRISIARAMLKDAPIIILDEATASIDPENEHLIQEALTELTRGKTIITIAHRLATIEHADQIIVMDNGEIAQKGKHEKLIKEEGIYQDFIKIREQAEGWRILES